MSQDERLKLLIDKAPRSHDMWNVTDKERSLLLVSSAAAFVVLMRQPPPLIHVGREQDRKARFVHPKSRLARGFPSRLCVQKYLEDLVATTASIQMSDCPKCSCSLVPASCRCTEEDVSPVTLTSTITIKGSCALANQAYSYRTYCIGRDDSK